MRERLLALLVIAALGGASLSQAQPGEPTATASPRGDQPVVPEPTIHETQIWDSLLPPSPTDMGHKPGDTSIKHKRYVMEIERSDPKTGLPIPLTGFSETRATEINDYRRSCVGLVRAMYDENRANPVRIPQSQFESLSDQSAEMVAACVNQAIQREMVGMKGVGIVFCVVLNTENTPETDGAGGHCVGPMIWNNAKGRSDGAQAGK